MAARSSFVLAVPSTATLFFSSSQLLNQKSAKEHQAMRMQSEEAPAEVGDFSEATAAAELPQRTVPGDRHLQSWQQLSQARMCHTVQRRFLSSLKNQSLRE